MSRIFSTNYPSVLEQSKIEKALEAGDFSESIRLLESIHFGYKDVEKVEYLITMKEGYRAIASIALGLNPQVKRLLSAFTEFTELGEDTKTLGGKLDELKAFRYLGPLKEVQQKVSDLQLYQRVGSLKEIEEKIALIEEEAYALEALRRAQ